MKNNIYIRGDNEYLFTVFLMNQKNIFSPNIWERDKFQSILKYNNKWFY